LSNLPSTSSNSITGTWSPAMNNTATTNYTFTPDTGQCAVTSSIDIVVNPIITPFFNAVNPICSGDTLPNLPSTSSNSITGTWSPAMNNTATTNYTFTPDTGQCAVTSNIDIVVNPIITPSFSVVNPICSGDTLPNLPSTSSNGVTGTWSPAMNNTATTNYTFTPDTGQCAVTSNIDIVVNPIITPSFSVVNPICSGDTLPNLPSTSSNGVTGTWSPSLDNTTTTTYTFTPDAGQCAITSSIDIVVNPIITPFFSVVNPIRIGDTLSNLPSTSNNGIKGTWSPAMNNTATTNYTFTPTPGQCAVTSNIEIVVSNINNAFSPNGDGVNDIFIIPILFNYLDFEIEVFNRWGTKVYYYNNNGSTSPSWWDGYATVGLLQGNSKPLPVGTYYYIIRLNNKVKEKITGWIYLNR
jgi:gliding motility-associated-like protein